MSIQDELDTENDRSLYAGIAATILREIEKIENTRSENQNRWIWELIQNAVDTIRTIDRKIKIGIHLREGNLLFTHNGEAFSKKDITRLINQVSSKTSSPEEKREKSGRFGTGFVTSQLISKKAKIIGILNKDDQKYRFEFLLDRDTNAPDELIEKIRASREQLKTSLKLIEDQGDKKYYTEFEFLLNENMYGDVQEAIDEFIELLPMSLLFVDKLDYVVIKDDLREFKCTIRHSEPNENDLIQSIEINRNDVIELKSFVYDFDDDVQIACEVNNTEEGIFFLSQEKYPKVFCEFPLIGTESFIFPITVNSFDFNPFDTRNQLYLAKSNKFTILKNKELLSKSTILYLNLMDKITNGDFYDIYHIILNDAHRIKENEDKNWLDSEIKLKILKALNSKNIIELDSGLKESPDNVWFPGAPDKEARSKIWDYYSIIASEYICNRSHIEYWNNIPLLQKNVLSYRKISERIEEFENVSNLSNQIKLDIVETISWLNEVLNFLSSKIRNTEVLNSKKLFPNKNGNFEFSKNLYIDNIEDEQLITITEILGDDWNDKLVIKDFEVTNIEFDEYTKKEIANEITDQLRTNSTEPGINAIGKLLLWFSNNMDEAAELFPELFPSRNELMMRTFSVESQNAVLQIASSGYTPKQLLKSAKILDDNPKLRELLESDDFFDFDNLFPPEQSEKMIITEEILVSHGISSMEDLNKVLKIDFFKDQFVHTSVNDPRFFNSYIEKRDFAQKKIIEHLKDSEEYEWDNIEFLTEEKTILFGIFKVDKSLDQEQKFPIYIVTRPSDYGKVIIYDETELNTLDLTNSELWIASKEHEPEHLTLGTILEENGINRIEVSR